MLANIDTKILAGALAQVSRAAARRSYVECLNGVRIVAGMDALELTCTDLETTLTVSVPADVTEPGAIIAPNVRALSQAVKSLAGTGTVLLSAVAVPDDQSARLSVTVGGSGQTFDTFAVADWPADTEPGTDVARFRMSELAGPFGRVAHAYSADDTRPVLSAVQVTAAGSSMRLAATDSYRLAVETFELSEPVSPEWRDILVPGRALELLCKTARRRKTEPDPHVTLYWNGERSRVTFELEGRPYSGGEPAASRDSLRARLTIRTQDGQYPDVDRLRPEGSLLTGEWSPDVAGTVAALRRFNTLAGGSGRRSGHAPARLELSGADTVRLEILAGETTAVETVPAGWNGEPLTIGFNPAFLADALESLESETVHVHTISALRPAILSNGKPDCWRLVMPIRLAG